MAFLIEWKKTLGAWLVLILRFGRCLPNEPPHCQAARHSGKAPTDSMIFTNHRH